jgi:hypothetical protein
MVALSEKGEKKEKKDTVNINKVILNFEGGIKAYNVKYISKSEQIGVLDKTLYTSVETDKEGKHICSFFKYWI